MATMIQPPSPPEERVAALVRLLDVEEIDRDLMRGARKPGGVGRVFGGQVIAQALASATRSIEDDKVAHSLHAYFMRGGDEDWPIVFRVVRDFDGRSFATRRIIALQKGKPILNMAASFQRPEEGFAHHAPMPDVPRPDALPTMAERIDARSPGTMNDLARDRMLNGPIELRPCEPFDAEPGAPPFQSTWFRAVAPLPEDPRVHRAVLAYASDIALLGTSLRVHGGLWDADTVVAASLDHALWLHETPRADDWLLYACDSPWAGGARGFNRGLIYAADGRLVASAAQEGLIRPATNAGA
ncbi:acyl-CoA thioesterase [Sphingomonas sp.]|uniref:acyl-CoA thioesterase n=1 Tax=Sphingomonas sp. TaxID=28214 RepID=UPI003B005850